MTPIPGWNLPPPAPCIPGWGLTPDQLRQGHFAWRTSDLSACLKVIYKVSLRQQQNLARKIYERFNHGHLRFGTGGYEFPARIVSVPRRVR